MSDNKLNIGVSGYFGYHNFGDEIFLQTWKKVFQEHNVYQINQYIDIKSLDRIIIGGGDLLDTSFFTNAYWRPEFFEVPTYVYGIGVPNMPENRNELNKYTSFLAKCKDVCVRDQFAVDYLVRNGLYANPKLVEDIAWSYSLPNYNYFGLSENKVVGISYRFNRNFDWKNLLFLAEQVAKDDYDILLIPLQPAYDPNWRGNDDGIHHELKKHIEVCSPKTTINIISDSCDIDQRISFIKACDYYITQRFHGTLISLRTGTPCITLGDSSKFIKVLERFGMQDSFCKNDKLVILEAYNMLKKDKLVVNKELVKRIEERAKKQIYEFKEKVINGKD